MITIISDIHDNLVNLDKVLKYCKEKNITTLVCCGDVCNSDTLKYLAENFKGQIYLSAGNMELFDEDEPNEYKNIIYYYRNGGTFEYENKIIGVCHEPYRVDILIKQYNQSIKKQKNNKKVNNKKIDIIFYGHTHQPWEQEQNNIKIVNPGNVANSGHQPSFATYEVKTDKLKLYLLNEM